MDASYLVDGVARGTLSLARNTVGGFADSAAMIAETFSKNMTVLTLDRRYAQKRDRREYLRDQEDVNVALGIGSGVNKVVKGFLDGVTGVVKAPIRGAEKRGFEGFAKGLGKGLLGLLVKPIIGISDGFGDVMIGVKGSVDAGGGRDGHYPEQVRIRRAFYGQDKALRIYNVQDSAAAALMLRTRLAGEAYFSHLDMMDRVALLSVKRLLIIGPNGQELLLLKFKDIESWEIRAIGQGENKETEWGIIVILNTPRSNGSEIEVITCHDQTTASQLSKKLELATNAIYDDEIS
jgi:Vacuolar-sorting-associated 13 protein C-terminal/Autophagy-related protein C terminal domain